ncbi:hypothetical protein CTAYLR_007120 [Chrysophaeum taylorii]|uniref:Sulfatase-modifying factor enzyme-like domain-containing protein n=1 Tax=Chrysophaeum taylorii TaxID=2483200 RepID=A0AAD7U774_9STRA|nr:hypothetical protein CTAYLR_007120 [Chrysophaeum taylorii]
MLVFSILVVCGWAEDSPAVPPTHPFVGWQPRSALRMVPETYAGNESAFLLVGSPSLAYTPCWRWWPRARATLGKSLAKEMYGSAFFVRCGLRILDDSVVAEAADDLAADDALSLIRGPLGARAYAVVEWDANTRIKNATRFAESIGAVLARSWSGVVFLVTAGQPEDGILERIGRLYDDDDDTTTTKRHDVVVVVDTTSSIVSDEVVVYSRHPKARGLLVSDLWQPPLPPKSATRAREDFYYRSRDRGLYRICAAVDVNNVRLDMFELYSGFMATFRGKNNNPWLGIAPPQDSKEATWRREVGAWRGAMRSKLGFNESDAYAAMWPNILSPQVMIHDRYLSVRGNWTVDRWLSDVRERYGGVDSVLLWQSYPNIGVDDRSQFDMLDDVENLEECIRAFQKEGIKVLLPYNPWDHGTRRPGGEDELLAAVERLGADGFNGDTMYGIPDSYYKTRMLLNPECGADGRDKAIDAFYERNVDPYAADAGLVGRLSVDQTTWNYYPLTSTAGIYPTGRAVFSADTLGDQDGVLNASRPYATTFAGFFFGPPIASRYKALETRHNPMVCDRWSTDRIDGFHHAFFNGGGYATWENVWGIFNGFSKRDAQISKQFAHLFRAPFVAALVFGSTTFEPYSSPLNNTLPPGLFAATFNNTLHLVVNRRGTDLPANADDPATSLPSDSFFFRAAVGCYDIWNGRKVVEDVVAIEPMGFAALYVGDQSPPPAFLAERRALTRRKLATYDADPLLLSQRVVDIPSVEKNADAIIRTTNMTLIPGGPFLFEVNGVQVEGWGGIDGATEGLSEPDVQFAWEDRPRRFHKKNLTLDAFYVDTYPVTNANFLAFLDASAYSPSRPKNFLKHLADDASSVAASEQPVRWVALDDARAYCGFYGKRLPRSYEWQRAAQGPTPSVYPWGDEWDDDAVPPRDHGFTMSPPPDVGTHPSGQSPEGVNDLVATIWQWSDEFCDDHTCRAIIRGGSTYRPLGAPWYLPHAYRNDEQQTYLLFSDALDRSAAIGFRCVADANTPSSP